MLMHCTIKMSYTENVCMSNWVMSCMCIGQMYPFKHFHLRPSLPISEHSSTYCTLPTPVNMSPLNSDGVSLHQHVRRSENRFGHNESQDRGNEWSTWENGRSLDPSSIREVCNWDFPQNRDICVFILLNAASNTHNHTVTAVAPFPLCSPMLKGMEVLYLMQKCALSAELALL